MGVSLGLVGLGSMGGALAPIFYGHTEVSRVGICDVEPDRLKKFAENESWKDKLDSRDIYTSFEDICKSDLDALVIHTQPYWQGRLALEALKAGKHVYSAAPVILTPDVDEILDVCDQLVEACKRTGMQYMLGDTTYFRPESMYCRRKAKEGAFGDFVYGEGEYCHDLDAACSLRGVEKQRLSTELGRQWVEKEKEYFKRGLRYGPLMYTFCTPCMPVSLMNTKPIRVSGFGYRNTTNDPYFSRHVFSNEFAMFEMANGSTVRAAQFREVAGNLRLSGDETFSLFGTKGSFRDRVWTENGRDKPFGAKPLETTTLTEEDMFDPVPEEVKHMADKNAKGHGGSHVYLVHEFVDSVAKRRLPAMNIWEAARYTSMSVMAHQSAVQNGKSLDVPDWGDAPNTDPTTPDTARRSHGG